MNSFVQLEGSAFASRSGSSFAAHLVAVCSQEDSLIHAGSGSLGRAVICANLCFVYCFIAHVGFVERFGLMCAGWEFNRQYYDAVAAI